MEFRFRVTFLKPFSVRFSWAQDSVSGPDLAEGDGEEAAGGRAGAAAAERPRREGAAVDQPPPPLQLVEVLGEVHGGRRRRLELPRRRVRPVQVLLARREAPVQPGDRALRPRIMRGSVKRASERAATKCPVRCWNILMGHSPAA